MEFRKVLTGDYHFIVYINDLYSANFKGTVTRFSDSTFYMFSHFKARLNRIIKENCYNLYYNNYQ